MRAIAGILALALAIATAGPALAEGEPKSRTECADMKEMIWDSATQTCNPIKISPTPSSSPPHGQPSDSETSDRTPEMPTPAGSEKDRTTPADPATKTPRAPDDMKK